MVKHWPLDKSIAITSPFGQRGNEFHRGVDFGCPSGAPLYAAADGWVIEGRDRRQGSVAGFGSWIWIDCQNSAQADLIYGHVAHPDIVVTKGDFVKAGDFIGRSGSEGTGSGPHLHFETWSAPGRLGGQAIDPIAWLDKTEDTTTVIYGPDISNNNGAVDISQIEKEGFDFLWCKVSEGTTFKDSYWPSNRNRAKAAGLILAGYHYIRVADAEAQAENFVNHLGDKTIPAMLDFEQGSGGIDMFWAVKNAIEKRGVRVALSYIPDWYWESIGKPNLSNVPGLISSEYVNGIDYASRLYPGNNWHGWKSYGGRAPDILQFTSSAVIAGKRLDANAFRGTPDQLRKLLGQTTGDDTVAIDVPKLEWEKLCARVDFIYDKLSAYEGLWPSRAIFADSTNGVDDTVGMLLNSDGNIWDVFVILTALAGSTQNQNRIARLANGQGPHGNDPRLVDLANELLQFIREGK